MNKVHLIGNLTKDVDLRYTKHNTPVASYTIAVNTGYGELQETNYFNITTWGKSGEFVKKYFKKGQSIALTGRLKNKNYEDSKGIKHYGMEVVTEDIEFVGYKKETDAEEKEEADPFEIFGAEVVIDDDELPF